MERELADVTRLLAEKQWPIRQHATYDQSISRILDVFEPIFNETGYRARWGIDHAEAISPRNIARIKAMGGGIAIQGRIAFAGGFFAERYGAEAAAQAPPIRQMLDAGLTVGGYGRNPRRELQSLDLALLDGNEQDRRRDAARIS
jgi:predicted amidohydrolase YtcJ